LRPKDNQFSLRTDNNPTKQKGLHLQILVLAQKKGLKAEQVARSHGKKGNQGRELDLSTHPLYLVV
jgi:hypothetical protein